MASQQSVEELGKMQDEGYFRAKQRDEKICAKAAECRDSEWLAQRTRRDELKFYAITCT
jgi:hypothetical protein